MNIKEAKEEIKKTVEIYLDKNEFGEYTIPVSKQRPIFMVGAPGIGKTAIMQQIASELDIALVSYSMTHHTRQSALGLPVIEEKEYAGKQFTICGYTMSEIIATVYNVMKDSGKTEGILFLDEINCVSETLAPAMLLFLQYKIFGNQQVPEGWVVVTAGNPPQYNKSVKEFDVATMDRLKRLDITEDFSVWKQYAYQQGIHAAIIAFLEINQQWFYSIQNTVDGMQYVTARGWEDLSTAILLYEKKGFSIDRRLIDQYITHVEIARKFGVYYDLYQKYKSDYQIQDILSGNITDEMIQKCRVAKIDERFSIHGLLMEKLNEGFREAVSREHVLQLTVKSLRIVKKALKENNMPVSALLGSQADTLKDEMQKRIAANSLTGREKDEFLSAIHILTEYESLPDSKDTGTDFTNIKKKFDRLVKQHEKHIKLVQSMLEYAFSFIIKVWGENQELVLFMTELTTGTDSLFFIDQWGCASYFRYNQDLLTYDQGERLGMEIRKMMSLELM